MSKKIRSNQSGVWWLPLFTILAAGALAACGKTESADICLLEEEEPLSDITFDKPDAVEIPFYITSTMVVNPDFPDNRGGEVKEICTPHAYKELLNRVLQLYASIEDFNVTFRYAGLLKTKLSSTFDDVSLTSLHALPLKNKNSLGLNEYEKEGVLFISLNDPSLAPSPGIAGMGAPRGPWGPPHTKFNSTNEHPTTYPGGTLFVFPEHDLATLIHEIGHTLGLTHIPSASSLMSYQGLHAEGYNRGSYYKLTEQDRADLIAAFPAPGAKSYTISGTVKATGPLECEEMCQAEGGPLLVHVANTVTGQTYSGLGFLTDDPELFEFDVNVLEPGTYKIMTALLPAGTNDPSTRETSWYVDADTSTNDPAAATVLTLSDASPRHDDIRIILSEEPATSWFDVLRRGEPSGQTRDPDRANDRSPDVFPMYLSPGETTRERAELTTTGWEPPRAHTAPYTSLQILGSAPAVEISEMTADSEGYYMFRTTASEAAKPGDYLVVAEAGGKHVSGLIGINVQTNAEKPTYVDAPLKDQLLGKFDFTTLDPNYWK